MLAALRRVADHPKHLSGPRPGGGLRLPSTQAHSASSVAGVELEEFLCVSRKGKIRDSKPIASLLDST